ncbi:restriction endonuclease subunit S [Sediminicoccus rosea]|uniref:Restriction endonuclease subunit S n=1 Tax=Sediminicoccus rosea TaxID=1225128 RepID=A0ABZ0PCT8_9PROT|nr:restriction endonuclease subunit S [Sediminicoccus rosea]WPB83106.1 restriction endonuclease subunit S [Sediminicoccus rosea]
MSTALRPYSQYRDSGVDWLPRVPTHWEVVRNGRLFAERNETGFPDLPILEVSLRTGVRIRDMEGGRKQQMADRAKYKRAAQGDIAYNIMRMWQGAVGIAPCDGLISPAYVVAKPFDGVDSRFYTYLFRTSAYMREVDFASRGIVPDRNRLYWQYFKPMLSPAPPPEEQERIADYLDAYTTQVQRLIAGKRRIIAALIERKRSIITSRLYAFGDAGLSPTPCNSDWPLRAIKRLASVSFSSVDKHTYEHERQVRVCHYVDVYKNDSVGPATPFREGSVTESEYASYSLKAGDVLVTKDSEDWKDICVPCLVTDDIPNAVCGYHLAILRPNTEHISGDYLYFALLAAPTTWQFHKTATGITRYGIGKNEIGTAVIPLPARVEQGDICRMLNEELRSIDAAKDKVVREIDLIVEYRDSLIAAVVTGQLDVRNAVIPIVEGDLSHDAATGAEELEDALDAVD